MLSQINKYTGIVSLGMIYLGLYVSPALMSIGMVLLLCNALFSYYLDKSSLVQIRHHLVWSPLLFFAIYILSGLYSKDIAWWQSRVLLKLPLLAIPIGILSIRQFDNRLLDNILKVFWWSILLGILGIFYTYLKDMDHYNKIYGMGQVLPTPVMHSRYSILVAIAIYVGIYISYESIHNNAEKWITIISTVFMVIFLHILAVRTGLACFYGSAGIVLLWYIIQSKRYLQGGIALGMVVLVLGFASTYVPSLKKKVEYTITSIQTIQAGGRIDNLSDSYRVASVGAGIHIGNTSPIVGIGIGDVRKATADYVKKHYPSLAHVVYTPQSQYILTYAGLGLLGVLILLLFNVGTIAHFRNSYCFMGIMSILFVMLVVEQIMETQAGTAIYMLVYGVLARWKLEQTGKKLSNSPFPPLF